LKLSERTTHVLKNFSSINSSILVRQGSTLETIAPSRKVVAKASVPNDFDREFAIYDLPRFLGAISLFKDPDLSFGDKSVVIQADGRSLTYVFAAPEMVLAPPAKGVKFPSEDVAPQVKFTLTQKVLQDTIKAAGVLGMKELAFIGANGVITLEAADTRNPTAHGYGVVVGETDHRFRLIFALETFKFIPGDYEVTVSMKKIAHFVGEMAEYYVVAEDTSSV
jgi:hypothetical protein